MQASYWVFVAAAAAAVLALVLRWRLVRRVRGPVTVPAALVLTQKQQESFVDPQGDQRVRTVGMTLTFQTVHNELLTFQLDPRYRGRAKEKQWGDLRYKGSRLISFTCPQGTIRRRLFG